MDSRYDGTHALESVLGTGAGWLQTLQHCSLVCRDVQVVMYSYCVDIILSPHLHQLQLAGQSETHPTADNNVSMSRTEQIAVSPAEQKLDGEFEYSFYQMVYELFDMFHFNSTSTLKNLVGLANSYAIALV